MTIALRGVTVGRVLRGIDLAVGPEDCVGVIGLNGAGKSTLVATMAGVIRPDAGSIEHAGPWAYLPEGCPLDPSIRVGRWIALARRLPGWEEGVGQRLIEAFALDPQAFAGQLSQGQRVRLGLILTLGREMPCYLLDDPFLGLDPVARTIAERTISERAEHASIVLAAQDTDALERLCTHLALLDGGQVLWSARVEDWRNRFRAVRLFTEGPITGQLQARVVAERQVGWARELVVDDEHHDLDRWLNTLGIEHEPLSIPMDELLTEMVRDVRAG